MITAEFRAAIPLVTMNFYTVAISVFSVNVLFCWKLLNLSTMKANDEAQIYCSRSSRNFWQNIQNRSIKKWKHNEKTTIRKSKYMQNMHIAQNSVHFHYLKSILICLGGKGEYFMPILKYRNARQLDHLNFPFKRTNTSFLTVFIAESWYQRRSN